MSAFKREWISAATALLCFSLAMSLHAQDQGDGQELMQELRRKTPSGQYVDPASFFRFHGYISLSYTEAGKNLGPGPMGLRPGSADPVPEGTPNILVSGPGPSALTGENEGGFRNDAALFVGGEPFDGVSGVIEIHFVGDATNPVITEAKMTWDLVGRDGGDATFRLVGGRFWWPFGIHNGEWFSAVNRFSLLSPTATEVVPAHYNEVGIMGEGELKLQDSMGLNYVLCVGNGMPGFDMMPNVRATTADNNDNRTLTGRLGLVLHSGLNAELGLSASSGTLRSKDGFTAFGPDLTLDWKGLGLRSYLYKSAEETEELSGVSGSELDRDGLTIEPSYTFVRDTERYGEIVLVGRFSRADEEILEGKTLRRTQLGIGLNLQITRAFNARLGFVSQGEDEDLDDADNNAITLSLTNEF